MTANLLSAARLALALPFAVALFESTQRANLGEGPALATVVAASLFVVAAVSDLLDGVIARASGTTSEFGRLLDHLADFSFVEAGLVAAAWAGALPWALPPLVGFAFAQYVADSMFGFGSGGLRASRLGRINGVLYFFPLGGVLLAQLGAGALAEPSRYLAWFLALTTLVSVAQRLAGARLARRQRAPAEPVAGTADRSPR